MSERQLFAITIAVAAVCIFVLGMGVAYGEWQHSGLAKKTQEARNRLRELPRLEKEIDDLRTARVEMAALVDDVKRILPSEEGAREHLLRDTISTCADESGLDWVSFKPKGGASASGRRAREQSQLPYVKEEYELKVKGGFHAFAAFINKLEEECLRLIWIETLKIAGAAGGLDLNNRDHDIALTLATFKFKSPAGQTGPGR